MNALFFPLSSLPLVPAAGARGLRTGAARRLLIAALVAGLGLGAPAAAASQDEINTTLQADTALWQGLFAVALADEIRNQCATIEARTFRATTFVYGLYSRARDYGYSRQEIRAFQTADSTEVRMRAEIGAYIGQHGVRAGAPETYCALGLSEIAAGTQAGELLRAR